MSNNSQQQNEINQQMAQVAKQVENAFSPITSDLQKTIFAVANQFAQMQVSSNIQIKSKDEEIKRLRELCEKNNIDTKPVQKTPPKESKIAPVVK